MSANEGCMRKLPLLFLLACGSPSAPPAQPTTAASTSPATSTAPPVASSSAGPAQSKEDKEKAEAAARLKEERAKWEADNKTELARWTPELHAAAKTLAEKTYPTGKAAIEAAIAGKHRKPGNADRDKFRHPAETLDFFGFKPTMTVLDIGPGEGWYTELLAPALAAKGKLLITQDTAPPMDDQRQFYADRTKAFLAKAPELYGKVQIVSMDAKAPALGLSGTVDMVLIMRGVHGMVNRDTLGTWLSEIGKALKPGGVLGIEEHRAKADADPKVSSKKGYVPEKWLVDQIEAAGFKLAQKSEINANAKDTKDYEEGVWTLPPTLRLGAKDKDKWLAIGESDRMTLKFVKK